MRVRKIPMFPICAVLIVAAVIAVGFTCNNGDITFITAGCGLVGLAMGSDLVRSRRHNKMRRHPLFSLEDGQLRYLCRQHAEVDVRFYDSVRAGNCIVGTREFVRRSFGRRRSISLAELARYSQCYLVKEVIVYKLKEAGIDWQAELANYTKEPREELVCAA